jgi:hypothetical protein
VLAGVHDGIGRDQTDALVHAISGAQEVIIPNASLMAPLGDPTVVDAAI